MNIEYLKELVSKIAEHVVDKHDGSKGKYKIVDDYQHAVLRRKLRCDCGEEWEIDLRRIDIRNQDQSNILTKELEWIIDKKVRELEKKLEKEKEQTKQTKISKKDEFNNVTSYLRL